MDITLSLSNVEVSALETKRLTPTEPLDAVLRRLWLDPLVVQHRKDKEFARVTRLLSLFQAAPRDQQRAVIEQLGGTDAGS